MIRHCTIISAPGVVHVSASLIRTITPTHNNRQKPIYTQGINVEPQNSVSLSPKIAAGHLIFRKFGIVDWIANCEECMHHTWTLALAMK